MTKGMPWELHEVTYDDFHPVNHVVPKDDLKPHDMKVETKGQLFRSPCWCHAYLDEGIIVHNAMDRREEYEQDHQKFEVRMPS